MDLKVMIMNGHFTMTGNYFIIAQLDEIEFPSKERKSQKQRTELLTKTSNPRFKKNLFTFNGLSYGSRLTLKLGVFMTNLLSENGNNQELIAKSKMVGSAALTLTSKLITLLRSEKRIEQDLQILQVDGNKELGRLAVQLKYRPAEFEAQIQDDIHMIENIYYDVFETDIDKIREKSKAVEQQLLVQQKDVNKTMKKLHFLKNAHKLVSYDLGNLRKQIEDLENENNDLRERIQATNDVDEIHIHIDLLKQTDQGIDILRQKFVILSNKLTFERATYNELSEHYFHIEEQIQNAKQLQRDIDDVKEASRLLDFHIKRGQDVIPHIETLKNTIQSQESVIKNLQSTIQTHLKNNDRLTSKDLKLRVEQMRHQKQLLVEKEKQLDMVLEMGRGQLNYKEYQKLSKDEMLREDPEEIDFYKKKNEKLMKQIEEQTKELEYLNAEEDFRRSKLGKKDFDVHMDNFDRNQIIFEIEQNENKARILQEELIRTTKQFAVDLSELKIKRNLLNNLIEANSNIKEMIL